MQRRIAMSETYGIIQVKRLEENEDGSANLEIETDVEATRLLVEVGLTYLLRMAIDKEEGYELKHTATEDVVEIAQSSQQEEDGQGTEALPESDEDDIRGSK
jgi:hypothetical protein